MKSQEKQSEPEIIDGPAVKPVGDQIKGETGRPPIAKCLQVG